MNRFILVVEMNNLSSFVQKFDYVWYRGACMLSGLFTSGELRSYDLFYGEVSFLIGACSVSAEVEIRRCRREIGKRKLPTEKGK
jgi:hypothetical protein